MTSSPLNRWRFPPFATHLSACRVLMRICGGTLLLLLISPHLAVAQSQSELKVKAAYVFNLTKYVEWPDHKKSLVIAVEGDGPMVATLRDALAGKVSDSRNMEVVISPTDADLDRCDVLYVARSDKKRIDAALRKVAGHSVLTVGDAASFTKQGGAVALLTVGDRIEIQINLQASQKARLKISSRLLNLATVVNDGRNSS